MHWCSEARHKTSIRLAYNQSILSAYQYSIIGNITGVIYVIYQRVIMKIQVARQDQSRIEPAAVRTALPFERGGDT